MAPLILRAGSHPVVGSHPRLKVASPPCRRRQWRLSPSATGNVRGPSKQGWRGLCARLPVLRRDGSTSTMRT
eukprot:11184810-Lingulodinium_polyedra.AAC.1